MCLGNPFSSLFFARMQTCNNLSGNPTKGAIIMAMYVSLIQFTDQGIRNVKDTIKRSEAAIAEAEKMGMKITDAFWTMGGYDVVVLFDAPDDETMTVFRRDEMEGILAKIK